MSSPVKRLPSNIFSSSVGFGLRIAIAFFFVPFITGILGDARYGVWVLVFQLVNYFFVFDIGMERSLSRYIPKFLAERNWDGLNRVLNTATLVYAGAGLAVLLAGWAVIEWVFPLFEISSEGLRAEGRLSLLLIASAAAVRFVFFPFGGSLGAMHRFDVAKGLEIAEEVIKTAVFVILLLNGYGLVALAATIAALALVRNVAGFLIVKRIHPEVRVGPKFINGGTFRMLLAYSRMAFAAALLWLMVFNSDSILLGLLVSSAAVGIYAPGAQMLAYARQLITAICAPLAPVATHLESTEGLAGVRRMYLKALTYAAYASGLIGVGLIAFAGPFIDLWLPAEFADAQWVLFTLGIGSFVFLPQIVSTGFLFALDKHKHLVWILLIELGAKVGLAVAMLIALKGQDSTEWLLEFPALPLVLMASAAAFPQIVLSLTAYPAVMSRVLSCRLRTVWHTLVVPCALAAAIAAPASHTISHVYYPDNWFALSINVAVVVLLWAIGLYFLVLEPSDRERIREGLTLSRRLSR